MDVTLENVYIGMQVERGRHWRHGRWNGKGPGTVIGFSNAHGRLIGANTNGKWFDRFYVDCYGITSVGLAWCAVRWNDSGKESIYPIGARGPLGKWWTGSDNTVDYGDECFALVTEDKHKECTL